MNTRKGYYLSESKGQLKIKDMPGPHIKNAMVKLLEGEVKELKNLDDEKFIKALSNLCSNKTFDELYQELCNRQYEVA